MRLPVPSPARPSGQRVRASVTATAIEGLTPAQCCSEVCVTGPFGAKICHCILDLPICP